MRSLKYSMEITQLGDQIFKISQVSRQETYNYHGIKTSS